MMARGFAFIGIGNGDPSNRGVFRRVLGNKFSLPGL
jgi:hypothetical protein